MSLKHSVTARKRSCGKVMFLHLSVSHYSVHSRGYIPACNGQQGSVSQNAMGQGVYTPTSQQAGSTHPTGIPSCLMLITTLRW